MRLKKVTIFISPIKSTYQSTNYQPFESTKKSTEDELTKELKKILEGHVNNWKNHTT